MRSPHSIRRSQASGNKAYYHQWLTALESVVTEKNLVTETALIDFRSAWARAADRTPHGEPIELLPGETSPAEPRGITMHQIDIPRWVVERVINKRGVEHVSPPISTPRGRH